MCSMSGGRTQETNNSFVITKTSVSAVVVTVAVRLPSAISASSPNKAFYKIFDLNLPSM